MTEKISRLIARDYGITVDTGLARHAPPGLPRTKIFASPSRHAWAGLMLTDLFDLDVYIGQLAEEHGQPFRKFRKNFGAAVKRVERGSTKLLDLDRDKVLKDMRLYAGGHQAQVVSNTSSDYHTTWLRRSPVEGFQWLPEDIYCQCLDFATARAKIRNGGVLCWHLNAPDIALSLDERSRLPASANLTGLTHSERNPLTAARRRAAFFSLFEPQHLAQKSDLLEEVLQRWYLARETYYETSKFLLNAQNIPLVMSEPLQDAVQNGYARFGMLRQTERVTNRNKLTDEQNREYGALDRLEKLLVEHFRNNGFQYDAGYPVEFKDTPYEVAGRRLFKEVPARGRREVHVATICRLPTKDPIKPPFVVYKVMQGATDNWRDSSDPQTDTHPFARTGEYSAVDDNRRLQANVRVLNPLKTRQFSQYLSRATRPVYERITADLR
jgi:hypothetical protein